MGVVVRKSSPVVVTPSEPPAKTTASTIRLSSFDVALYTIPATVLLMFEQPIPDAAETIKRALSKTLVHYYPIAGRIIAGADGGEVHIHCNGEGVTFISATADCALKEAMSLDRSPGGRTLLDELAVYYPAMRCGPTDPLMLMQVTEFSCGGFVVGVTANHAVGDGAGWAQFLQAVGELARGFSAHPLCRSVVATSGVVANGDIMDLVAMIKQSKEKIPEQFKKSKGTNLQEPVDQKRQLDHQLRYNMLTVSSWRNLGFDKVDFGSGRAARVTPYAHDKLPFPTCMMSLPHKGKDGANIFTAMLKLEHVDTFLKELTRFT
ncbi:unnamed protein product [Urochloa decumbens]|uniref:Uncharacterized protein n=1 Tax=Urochloa decumbens TaxID=240449 RepID=A0ABC9AM69_9POAL